MTTIQDSYHKSHDSYNKSHDIFTTAWKELELSRAKHSRSTTHGGSVPVLTVDMINRLLRSLLQ